MLGKIISTTVSLFIMVYIICLIIFFFLQENIKESVDDLNYGTVELVCTSGILSKDVYTYLSDKAGRFGDFEIKLKLEKQLKPGIYDVFFSKEEIIGCPLHIGDQLTVFLQDRSPSLFGRLINATVLFYTPGEYLESNVKSIKTGVVAKNAENIVKGYDIIAEINRRAINGDFVNDEGLTIIVVTKMNYPSGRCFDRNNMNYGDELSEFGNKGENYIFDNGDFFKEEEFYQSGSEKLIRFIQK